MGSDLTVQEPSLRPGTGMLAWQRGQDIAQAPQRTWTGGGVAQW